MAKVRAMLTSMLKIGCIGFGGGSALIPVFEKEVVEDQKLVTKAEYDKDVVVASITPGALPVEIASGLGRACGKKYMLLAAVCMAFPGAFLTLLLLSVLSGATTAITMQIEIASIGIAPFILYLLSGYICVAAKEAKEESNLRLAKVILIFCTVFILSGGKSIYKLLGIKGAPPFGLSTVAVLALAYFFILWTNKNYKISNLIIPGGLILGYIICSGMDAIPYNRQLSWGLGGIMFLLTACRVRQSFASNHKGKIEFSAKNLLRETYVWILFLLVLSLPALILFSDTIDYLVRGLCSSFLSFGGGDAYLTVADGMFVEGGVVSTEEFYGRLVSIVNVLPGSILCKMLTGIGYLLGFRVGGHIWTGYLMALVGFSCSVAASGGVFSIVLYLYNCFENLDIFQVLKRWIRPIIAGLLLNVMISLINQTIAAAGILGIETWKILLLVFLSFLGNWVLAKKAKVSNIVLIVSFLALAFVVCNVAIFV